MIEAIALDHVVLRTTRVPEMIEFYCRVLGCTVERDTSDENGLTQLRAGTALIDLVGVDSKLGRMGGGPPTRENNNLDHICVQIAPLSEAQIVEHLESCGVEAGEFVKRYGAQGFGRSMYISDPEGNTVEMRVQQ